MEIKSQKNKAKSYIDYLNPKVLWATIGVLMIIVIALCFTWYQVYREIDSVQICRGGEVRGFCIPPANNDSTAKWKTYKNDDYEFEFKYPSEFTPTSNIASSPVSLIFSTAISEFRLEIKNEKFQRTFYYPPSNEMFTYTEKIAGNNKWYGPAPQDGGGAAISTYHIGLGNNTLTVSFPSYRTGWADKPGDNVKYKNELSIHTQNQILSTFKFTKAEKLVEYTIRGGLCEAGSKCEWTFTIESDGDYVTEGKVDHSISNADLIELKKQIVDADFTKIKSKTFSGTCPIAFDGQEAIYTFYLEDRVEVIAGCKVDIDYGSPPFKLVQRLLR